MGDFIMSLIMWVYSQDVKEHVRLYEIKFGWVELPKLILAWKGSVRTSRLKGVLRNGSLELKFRVSVSVQAAGAGLILPEWGRCCGMGPAVTGQSRLNPGKNPKNVIFYKTSFWRAKRRPRAVSHQIPTNSRAKGKLITSLIRILILRT